MKPELIQDVEKLQSTYQTTHTGNSYSVTIPNLTVLTDGYPICVKFDAASTSNITLDVNELGAKNVVDYFGNRVSNVRQYLIANLRYESTTDSFILQGKGGGGNATAAQILANKTATVDSGQITGTMPDNGAINITPSGSVQNIPAGYTSGGSVAAVTIPVDKVLTGTTIAGQNGTMQNNGAINITPSGSPQSIPSGYTTGGTVSAVVVPVDKVLEGTIIAGQTGTIPKYPSSPAQLSTNTTSPGEQTLIMTPPAGYYDGTAQVGDTDNNFMSKNILAPERIFGLSGTGSNIKSVQRGTLSALSATVTDIPISSVNLANSIVIFDFIIYSSSNVAKDNLIQGKLTSATNLEITIGNTPSTTVSIGWQVVEFQNVKSIQKGDLTTTGTSASATISSINTSKSIVFASAYSTSSTAGSSPAEFSRIVPKLLSGTQISFSVGNADTVINWAVVEFY